MYEPKLSLGDSVWVMQNNKPTQLSIVEVEVTGRVGILREIDWFVKYTLTGGYTRHECTPSGPGDFIFTTKEDLIKHLYENS
jgi:hypothetical protein